jgi:hypothetical protein
MSLSSLFEGRPSLGGEVPVYKVLEVSTGMVFDGNLSAIDANLAEASANSLGLKVKSVRKSSPHRGDIYTFRVSRSMTRDLLKAFHIHLI